MIKIEVTEEQAQLIQKCLDLYSRIGIGQLGEIKDHPTFQKSVENLSKDENGKTNWDKFHAIRKDTDVLLSGFKKTITGTNYGLHGGWGIHNDKVDESCRVAFDILQVIRHEAWKNNPDKNMMTVDSSVHLTTKDSDKIKVEKI